MSVCFIRDGGTEKQILDNLITGVRNFIMSFFLLTGTATKSST